MGFTDALVDGQCENPAAVDRRFDDQNDPGRAVLDALCCGDIGRRCRTGSGRRGQNWYFRSDIDRRFLIIQNDQFRTGEDIDLIFLGKRVDQCTEIGGTFKDASRQPAAAQTEISHGLKRAGKTASVVFEIPLQPV